MKKTLIANSGIQFIEIGFDISPIDPILKRKELFAEVTDKDDESIAPVTPYFWQNENIYIIKESINEEAIDNFGNIIEDEIIYDLIDELDQEDIYSITFGDALSALEDRWLPIAFLKKLQENEWTGPGDWARFYISKKNSTEISKYVIVFAFDTTLKEEWDDEDHQNLRQYEIGSSTLFSCPRT
ncbi:MAG: virulence factor SrfB [Saprospiraceae bacterium]